MYTYICIYTETETDRLREKRTEKERKREREAMWAEQIDIDKQERRLIDPYKDTAYIYIYI